MGILAVGTEALAAAAGVVAAAQAVAVVVEGTEVAAFLVLAATMTAVKEAQTTIKTLLLSHHWALIRTSVEDISN